jgi:hypothetical protein
MKQDQNEAPPTQMAVTCGRLVFFFVGFVMMAIPILVGYGGWELQNSAAWTLIIAGIAVIILGATLPPKVVAQVGFDLPFYLPHDD